MPNVDCLCTQFRKNGTSIISGWSDGKIRAFGPQTGRLQYAINDVHAKGVTALAVTGQVIVNPKQPQSAYFRIISGGADGQVRVWKISRHTQILENAMKEHKGTAICEQIDWK